VSIAGPPLSAVRTCLARYCIAKQLRRGYYTEQQTSQKDVDGFRHPNCDGGMITEARAFGRYELRGLLGQGGFATVYRAYDPLLAREVALKALLPHLAADAGVRARFLAEARALAGLRHSNVVTVFDVGEAAGQPFFAMELVAGETLAARLEGGPPPHAATLAWLAEIASALDYLHAAGLVHRDVKPANVVIETSGRAVLMDLGIARSIDSTSHTLTGASLGTPAYMSPEQVRGETAGPPADIYALGVVAFQLLTGQPPVRGRHGARAARPGIRCAAAGTAAADERGSISDGAGERACRALAQCNRVRCRPRRRRAVRSDAHRRGQHALVYAHGRLAHAAHAAGPTGKRCGGRLRAVAYAHAHAAYARWRERLGARRWPAGRADTVRRLRGCGRPRARARGQRRLPRRQ
jgi:hypothetical protein